MAKTKDELSSELATINDELNTVLKKLTDLEELPIIREYISLLTRSEILMREKPKKELELKAKEMEECHHLFVITEKLKEDNLPEDEVVVKCLKCGLTNGNKFASKNLPSVSIMQKITHQTIHLGNFISDKEVLNVEYLCQRYNELKDSISDKEISQILSNEIRCQSKPSIKKF